MTFSDIVIFGIPIAALIFSLWAFAVKIITLQKQVDGLRAALFTLERNTNERTKELQSKIDNLTLIKVEELSDHLTPTTELTPTQKLRRLARAKQVVNVAFEIIKQFGKPTPLNEKTLKLMLTMIERAEKLAQAQLVAEDNKGGFERGGVISQDNDGEAKMGWMVPKDDKCLKEYLSNSR